MGWLGRSRPRGRRGKGGLESEVPPWALVLRLNDYRAFLEELQDLLLERELDSTREGGVVLVRGLAEGPPLQIGLQTLAQKCATRPREAWRALMASHLDTVLTLGREGAGAGPGPERRDFESVRSMLKLRLYPSAAVDGDPDLRLIARYPTDDLVAALAYDLPSIVTSVPPEDAEAWGQTDDQLFSLGIRNLAGETLERDRIGVKPGVSLGVVHGPGFFVAAQLMRLERCLRDLGEPTDTSYGFLVAVPTRHLLIHHRILDARVLLAVNALIPQAVLRYHQGPGSLSQSLYWLRAGNLVRLPTEMSPKGVTFSPPREFVEAVMQPLGA